MCSTAHPFGMFWAYCALSLHNALQAGAVIGLGKGYERWNCVPCACTCACGRGLRGGGGGMDGHALKEGGFRGKGGQVRVQGGLRTGGALGMGPRLVSLKCGRWAVGRGVCMAWGLGWGGRGGTPKGHHNDALRGGQ